MYLMGIWPGHERFGRSPLFRVSIKREFTVETFTMFDSKDVNLVTIGVTHVYKTISTRGDTSMGTMP